MKKKLSYQELASQITELKQHNLKLIKEKKQAYKTKEYYQNLFNFSLEGIMLHHEGVILECNNGLLELTGYSREELIGSNGLLLVTQESRDLVMNNILSGHDKPYEVIGLHKNGKKFPVQLRGYNVKFNGKLCRIGEYRDISERIKNEEKIKESESKFRLLAENSSDVIYRMNIQSGKYEYISPASLKLFGYSPDQFYQKPLLIKDLIHPESKAYFEEEWNKLKNNSGSISYEYKIIDKQGKEKWLFQRNSFEKDVNGNHLFIEGTVTDITERKKSVESIKNSEAKLSELNSLKDKLFLIISHDLRGPLASTYEYLVESIDEIRNYRPEEAEHFCCKLISSTKNMLNMLDSLLYWAKMQTDQIHVFIENYSLQPIIALIIEEYSLSASYKNISMNHIKSIKSEILADKEILKTILRNLISNAIKFTNSGGIINISQTIKQDQVEVSISDNGIGISKERLDELFKLDTHVSTKGTAGERGTGLGLILCKDLVKKQGGNIWAESEEGKGSIFKFTLPIHNES